MEYLFINLKNNIDFFLRQYLDFSRKNYFEENESKDALFTDPNLIEREKALVEKYDLEFLKSNSTIQNYCENLYTIDVLDRFFKINFQDEINALDIGCKNWFYAKGEYFFFKKYCKKQNLVGIEIDGNRLYSNFYNRKEVAKYYTKGLDGCKYIHANFLEQEKKYNHIIWVLPFVIDYPMLKWGLPKKYFQPENMLKHAYESLENGGKIFIINQGESEYEIQKELCKTLNIKYTNIGEIKSEFLNYQHKRFGILISKDN